MIVALAGGVGAARMLKGLSGVVEPATITAVVNTGDDVVLHGLHISPDLDTVTYTLADAINPDTGWGLAGETWHAMDSLARYGGGRLAWFNLGDHDLGTHLYRTTRLAEGATLSEVTAEITGRWEVAVRLLPMSDDRIETRVVLAGGDTEIGFQEYFVGRHHEVAISGIRLAGIDSARPAPGVLDAIDGAATVVICPSNPIVSIGPVLAVAGVRAALARRRSRVVAVSPLIAGRALKGPADRMMTELGHAADALGVARLYADIAGAMVIDEADAALAPEIAALGMAVRVAPTIMSGAREAEALASVVLGAPEAG